MATTIVITGGGGQLGRFLAGEAARRGYDVRSLTRSEFDITDAAAADRHVAGADLVVNCAALTNVDAAEGDPEAAHAINTVGPGNLARACGGSGAHFIHVSTDYVFGGGSHPDRRRSYEISDATAPLNVYGRSKLAGEQAVHAALPGANVVRTSWVYTGGAGTDFVAVMRRLAGTDRTVDVVDDQAGSPTYVKDLAAALLEIYERGIDAPILHAANDGALSRFEQAQAVFAELGEDPERVRPVSTAEVPRPAHRPVFSALSMVESADVGLTPLRPWRAALAEARATQIGDGPIPSTP